MAFTIITILFVSSTDRATGSTPLATRKVQNRKADLSTLSPAAGFLPFLALRSRLCVFPGYSGVGIYIHWYAAIFLAPRTLLIVSFEANLLLTLSSYVQGATFLVMAVPIALLYRASLAEKFREWAKELRKWAKERQESKTAFVRFLAKMLLRAVPGEKSSSKDGAASENDGQKRKYPSNDGVAAENDGQKKIAPSKDGAAAENKAGGGLGGEDKPPGDDSQQVAEADMQVGQGKTPAQAMMMSINGANGEAVPDVGPRRRSWIKRLFRGDQVSDRGPEA